MVRRDDCLDSMLLGTNAETWADDDDDAWGEKKSVIGLVADQYHIDVRTYEKSSPCVRVLTRITSRRLFRTNQNKKESSSHSQLKAIKSIPKKQKAQ
eukprot:274262-Ditylum_brightwellii.AAC.1